MTGATQDTGSKEWFEHRIVKVHKKVDFWNCPFCFRLVNGETGCECGASLRTLEASKEYRK